jgi:hypothetical protein
MPSPDLPATFLALRAILEPFEPALVKVHDNEGHYYLDTAHLQKNGKPLFFGAVRTGKNQVSFHLMPVYLWPELLEGTSEALLARMQGKSCFNLNTPDAEVVEALRALTRKGFERYREAGYVGAVP